MLLHLQPSLPAMVLQRGSCWFGIESKSFEILLEQVKGEVGWQDSGERGRVFSNWIRFGENGLAWLLERVKACFFLLEQNIY